MNEQQLKKVFVFAAWRNLFLALLVGTVVGLIINSSSPSKKGGTAEVILGILGAFLGSVFLSLLRGGLPKVGLVGVLVFQTIGAIILVLIGRALTDVGK